jgi:hypothetical protein
MQQKREHSSTEEKYYGFPSTKPENFKAVEERCGTEDDSLSQPTSRATEATDQPSPNKS